MRDIKDEINKLGREKEVTLIGKTGYYRHLMKSANANTELLINGSFFTLMRPRCSLSKEK